MTKLQDDAFWQTRDAILQYALDCSSHLKGKRADTCLFDVCLGGVRATNILTGEEPDYCPPWLWILGVRGGDRVEEAKRMLATSPLNIGTNEAPNESATQKEGKGA